MERRAAGIIPAVLLFQIRSFCAVFIEIMHLTKSRYYHIIVLGGNAGTGNYVKKRMEEKKMMEKNEVYVNGSWRVYSLIIDGKKRWFVGRIGEMGYYWVSPTKKGAIAMCDAAFRTVPGGF